tara:strand:+ start:220 stop:552 length:333 start_codon:yes stop_codon:yes gene_type:complete
MKNLIKKEIQSLKLKYPNSKSYVQRLQQMLDIEVYTQKDFVSTGLITPRKKYEMKFPTVNLDERCCDVISYVGGYYIQMLCNGRYLLDGEVSTKIDWLETNIYTKHIKDV